MTPRLTILIPFYRDDPSTLLRSLDTQIVDSAHVEIRIMDDGSGDPGLLRRVRDTLANMALPTHLMIAARNAGRAATRNALQASARSDWVLFLDADMRIDHDDFLKRYLDRIDMDDCDVVFGGFDVEADADEPGTDLHRLLSSGSDCLPARDRARFGPRHVASSNLCVRKSVLLEQPFDPAFVGWGWEDSEWAARVSELYRLCHLDNPAVHLGLEDTDTLLSRFATSGANYRRFVEAHPALAETLPLFRIVRRIKHLPGHGLFRSMLCRLVRIERAPARLRVLALKLWRASHYAEAMR